MSSTVSTVELPASPEVRMAYEAICRLTGPESLRLLASVEWWVRDAVIWRYGR